MKKFLIIGNQNAITYKEVFPLFKEGKIFLGKTMNGSNRYFEVPDDYPLTEKTGKIIDGKKYAFVKGCRWFSNLFVEKENTIQLTKKYDPDNYPKYDNYDAINCDKVKDIPYDYDGAIGAPITILDKIGNDGLIHLNYEYEIKGIDRYIEDNPIPGKRFTIEDKEKYVRVIIERV